METAISFNKWTFYGRLFFIVPIIWLLYKPISNALQRSYDTQLLLILAFFICFVLTLGLFLFVGLFFRPIGVKIDYTKSLLVIKYIAKKPRQVSLLEIKGYSTTLLWTQVKNYKGVLLYLTDNKKIELTDFNIETHVPALDFLNEVEVKYFGQETSWFPFRPFKYKYHKN